MSVKGLIRHRERGIVALEFLLLFPFVIGLLYAAAAYGVLFLDQYRMQNAAQSAAQAGLYVDRSDYSSSSGLQTAVTSAANATLQTLVGALPMKGISTGGSNVCDVTGSNAMLHCHLTYDLKVNPVLPVISFGFLGTFPPLPDKLNVDAYAAF